MTNETINQTVNSTSDQQTKSQTEILLHSVQMTAQQEAKLLVDFTMLNRTLQSVLRDVEDTDPMNVLGIMVDHPYDYKTNHYSAWTCSVHLTYKSLLMLLRSMPEIGRKVQIAKPQEGFDYNQVSVQVGYITYLALTSDSEEAVKQAFQNEGVN
jgi:hypothetical protein